MTIGFFKPIILLPVSAFNNLTLQQAEAVLLHELSHIRRCDYLINFCVNLMHTLLYFNPFAKLFITSIEQERENCCDQLVVQYGYDRISYASALLNLEKVAAYQMLVLGATGKRYLFNRIEKIIGREKKKGFKFSQFTGIAAACFFFIAINSILIGREGKRTPISLAFSEMITPFHLFLNKERLTERKTDRPAISSGKKQQAEFSHLTRTQIAPIDPLHKTTETASLANLSPQPNIHKIDYNPIDGSLSPFEKENITSTINRTKKIVNNMQWEEVQTTIADALDGQEKQNIKQTYLNEINKSINWKNIENSLKVQYNAIDWEKMNDNLNKAITLIQIDSTKRAYEDILTQIDKTKSEIDSALININPLPDESVHQINQVRMRLAKAIKELKTIRLKKVVKL
ncbi:MAG: hypothetical protein NVSMB67_16030 [Flavisolibacter sp.]